MSQTVGNSGNSNIVVQIEGDRNQVNLKGLPHLTLTRYLIRRRVDNEADILSPYSFSIPMVGRDDELAKLSAWLDGPRPISVRILTGRAGAGKTRLALELIEARLADGWDSGIATSRELVRFFKQQNLQSWGWQKPTLLVIDYAANHAEPIYDWLAELSDYGGVDGKPLRLLLLERSADQEVGWWRTAFGYSDGTAKAIQRLLDPVEPIALPPVDERETKRAIFQAALTKGREGLKAPTPGEDTYFDQQLDNLPWGGEPLFLMMAGLLGAKHGVSQVLALSRTDLAFDLANRELERIGRAGGNNPSRVALLRHMAAYITLCGGLSRPALEEAIEEERREIRRKAAGDAAGLADLLIDLLPSASFEVSPILPDMIGEAACLLAMGEDSGTVLRAFERERTQVPAMTIRTAQDFAGQECKGNEISAPLAWLDRLIEHNLVDAGQLMKIADQLPEASVNLAKQAFRVNGEIAAVMLEKANLGDVSAKPLLALALDCQANRLSDLGYHSNALAVAEQAVMAYRELNGSDYDLARALNNLGNKRWVLGRENAIEPLNESVAIYERLIKRPDGWMFLAGLAMSLYNQGNVLGDNGYHKLAKSQLARSVFFYSEMSKSGQLSLRPMLARALNMLGISLSDSGCYLGAKS